MLARKILWGAVIGLCACNMAWATLQMNPLFSNGAVLQAGMPVPVWGWGAEAGSEVNVSFAGQEQQVFADKNGNWQVALTALETSSEPRQMLVTNAGEKIVFENMLVGEVWLVCGRSNIGFLTARITNFEQELSHCEQPLLRLLRVNTRDPSPAEVKKTFDSKGWQVAQKESVSAFSAIGWVFGSELQKAKNVPVGIVSSTWGGSRPVQWFVPMTASDTTKNGDAESKKFEKESQAYHAAGDGQTSATQDANSPGGCFNSHIAPLIPMAIRGAVIFFDAAKSDELLPLVENWRTLWNSNFPVVFIQTHRQGGPIETDPNARGDAGRTSFFELVKKSSPAAFAVALDTGVEGEKDIHPPNKRPVGERVALAARHLVYGEKIVASGPLITSAKCEGNKALLEFDSIGSGLVARGEAIEGFAVSYDKKNWHWARANIEGNKIVLEADSPIVAIRYAYASNNPLGNLYNKEGLPASPFELLDLP